MATRIAGISSGSVTWRNGCSGEAPSIRAGLVELVRDREPRRIEDDEGERQMQPDRQQRDHEQPVRRARPTIRAVGRPSARSAVRHRPDIGIEQEAPHHRRRDLADRIGREHGGEQQAPRRQAAGEQQRHAEAEQQLDMHDDQRRR